jgi:hypothetical protein
VARGRCTGREDVPKDEWAEIDEVAGENDTAMAAAGENDTAMAAAGTGAG